MSEKPSTGAPADGSEPGTGGSGVPDATVQLGRRADPRTNTVVKWVLRTGLALALVLLAIGLVLQLVQHHDQAVQVRMFDLLAPRLVSEKIMAIGVLVLTLTPACGVLSLLLSWIRERDGVYVGVGLTVVVVLTAAVVVGFAGA